MKNHRLCRWVTFDVARPLMMESYNSSDFLKFELKNQLDKLIRSTIYRIASKIVYSLFQKHLSDRYFYQT